MLNSCTGPVLPVPMQPPMSTTSSRSKTSGYRMTSKAMLVRAAVQMTRTRCRRPLQAWHGQQFHRAALNGHVVVAGGEQCCSLTQHAHVGPCRHGLAWLAETLQEEHVIPAGGAWLDAETLDDTPRSKGYGCRCAMHQPHQADGCSEPSAVL